MPKAPKKTSAKSSGIYNVVLTMGAFVFKGESPSLLEAIEQATPTHVKCQGVITVTKDKMQAALKLYPAHLRRMTVNKIYRQLLEKRLNMALH